MILMWQKSTDFACRKWRQCTQNNDIWLNDIQLNDIQHNDISHYVTQYNDTQNNDTQYECHYALCLIFIALNYA